MMGFADYVCFSELKGKTITSIGGLYIGSTSVNINCQDGSKYKMYHNQCCCEEVSVDEIHGETSELLNSPVLLAEMVTNYDAPKEEPCSDDYQWTFYKLSTINGSVTIKWCGSSNGYYSIDVDFARIK